MPKQISLTPALRSKKVKALQKQINALRAQLERIEGKQRPRKAAKPPASRVAPPVKGKSRANSFLTAREQEVLKLTVDELVAREIAKKLKIGVRTVESYRASLLDKLKCRSLVGLTRYALSRGIVSVANKPRRTKERPLTDREEQVLKLTAREFVAREIAQKLKIGVRTVESYRASLLEKLHCRSLVGLTRYAIAHGLVAG